MNGRLKKLLYAKCLEECLTHTYHTILFLVFLYLDQGVTYHYKMCNFQAVFQVIN